jgi:hypothetical protein
MYVFSCAEIKIDEVILVYKKVFFIVICVSPAACVVVFVWDSFGRVVEEQQGSIVVAGGWRSSLAIDHIASTALWLSV